MKSTVLILVVAMFVAPVIAGETARSAAGPVVKPANECWDPQVKRCCSVATLPDPVQCSADGITWTCAPVITRNPLILTMQPAALGFAGKENDGTETCRFTKRVCGSSPLTCLNDLSDTATCQKEKSSGGLCESQTE